MSILLPTLFAAAKSCPGGGFLTFPTWYHYLPAKDPNAVPCAPVMDNLNDIWLIVAAVIEILLRLVVLIAVGYIIFGGFKYLTSQAEPAEITQARKTILNALIGLSISVMAAMIVNFIAGSIT